MALRNNIEMDVKTECIKEGRTQASETMEDGTTAMSIQIETVKTDAFTMDYFQFGQGKETLVILPGLSVQSVMDSADAVA